MTIYDDVKIVADEVLADFKQGVVNLIQTSTTVGPADDPGSSTETSHTLDAVVKGVPFKYMNDSFILSTDLMVTAAILAGITPTINDFIEIDGVRCKIIKDVSVPGAGGRVVWKFLVRK